MTPSPNYPAPMRIPKGRVKSYTPPIVPGHHHQGQSQYHQSSKQSAVEREKPKEIDYFAGAKFDCLPSVSSLPTPPPEWTIPVLRSQSQPTSPVTTTVGVRIDVNSLFLTPQQVIKSSSFPGKESSGSGNASSTSMKKKRPEMSNFSNSNSMSMSKTVAGDTKSKHQQQYDHHHYHHHQNQYQNQHVTKKRDNYYPNAKDERKSKSLSSHSSMLTKNSSDEYKSSSAQTSPKLKFMEQSKPLDITITTNRLGSPSQRKQMYPHLTEHLRGLLKVQG